MTFYKERPTQRRARKAWDYAESMRSVPVKMIWKNPNCWMTPQVVGNAWGWWGVEYEDGKVENFPPSDF